MADYNQIRNQCNKSSSVSAEVVDEFLIYYAAMRDKKDKEFETRISRFKQAVKKMPGSWVRSLKSQYIAHEIFKSGGLISKYLNHVAIKELPASQREYLHQCAANPWRLCFSIIVKNPAEDFYEMEDIFTGESFLLYSPAVSRTLSETQVSLWFNLIAFDGNCWQTFGPVAHFQCFDSDDIYFFATELNFAIGSDIELMDDVESNPIPYMMLMVGSNYPLIKDEGFEIVQVWGEIDAVSFDGPALRKNLKVEYAEGVYRVSDEKWSEFPHHAEAFYDERKGVLSLFALTDTGYARLAEKLNSNGFNLPEEPEVRVHVPMLVTIEALLGKKVELNPYAEMFATSSDSDTEEMLESVNEILALAISEIDAGREPNLEEMAKDWGINGELINTVIIPALERAKKVRTEK